MTYTQTVSLHSTPPSKQLKNKQEGFKTSVRADCSFSEQMMQVEISLTLPVF